MNPVPSSARVRPVRTPDRVWIVAGIIAVMAAISGAPAASAATDAQRCERALLLASGKYQACLSRLRARAVLDGTTPDFRLCVDRFGKRTAAVHRQYLAACPKTVWNGGTQRFVDLGDGTVRDEATGLQWEKKRNLDGKRDPRDPHDADNVYTWTVKKAATAPDGTLFTEFLAALNRPPCFAGHCDWRMPSMPELHTILARPKPCERKPCIDPIFGPTASAIYWTGETSIYHPIRAWYVFFISGYWTTGEKVTASAARAVRGGGPALQ